MTTLSFETEPDVAPDRVVASQAENDIDRVCRVIARKDFCFFCPRHERKPFCTA